MKNTVRAACCILMTIVTLVLTACPAFAVETTMQGHFGEDLIWLFMPGNSTMYIEGEGDMPSAQDNGSDAETLWQACGIAERIRVVVIGEGITKIGSGMFRGCTALYEVRLPESLCSIGRDAFAYTALTAVCIPGSVTQIGSGAFAHCQALRSVTFGARHPADVCSDAFLDTPFLSADCAEIRSPIGEDGFTAVQPANSRDTAGFLKATSVQEHLPCAAEGLSAFDGAMKNPKKIQKKARKNT